jgi:hypothetical protein
MNEQAFKLVTFRTAKEMSYVLVIKLEKDEDNRKKE